MEITTIQLLLSSSLLHSMHTNTHTHTYTPMHIVIVGTPSVFQDYNKSIFHSPMLDFLLAVSDHLSWKQTTTHEKTGLGIETENQHQKTTAVSLQIY